MTEIEEKASEGADLLPLVDCPVYFHDYYQGTDGRVWTLTLIAVRIGTDDRNAPAVAVAHSGREHCARVFERERTEGDNTSALQRAMVWLVMLLGYVPNERTSVLALMCQAKQKATKTLAEGG